jgi:hypothetical protein
MSEPVVEFDAGVIDQVVTNREFRAVLEVLVRSGWTPVIPTPVLAEAITGRATEHPSVDGDVVDVDASLGQELLDVAVREAVAQVSAHGEPDGVRWEPEAGERPRDQHRRRSTSFTAPRSPTRTRSADATNPFV